MFSLNELQGRLEQLGESSSSYGPLASYLAQNLSEDMSISEIAQMIAVIDAIQVTDQDTSEDRAKTHLQSFVTQTPGGLSETLVNELALHAQQIVTQTLKQPLNFEKDQKFISTAIDLRTRFIELMTTALSRTKDVTYSASYEFHYPQIRLKLDVISEVSDRTKNFTSEDSVLGDIRRGTVTLDGKKISGTDEEIIKAIEAFTGDKVTSKGSKASKILYFGGQYLNAILLNEFKNATELNGKVVTPLVSSGGVNWKKTPDGEFVADSFCNIYSIDDGQHAYILDTEGVELRKYSPESRRGGIIFNSLSEHDDNDSRFRAPIATNTLSLKLVSDKKNHYLNPTSATLKYNTRELHNLREIKPIPRNLKEWQPLQFFFKSDLSKIENVEKANRLLQSFTPEEWSAMKTALQSSTLKNKVVQVYVQSQLHRFFEKPIHFNTLTKNLKNALGEDFNKSIQATNRRLGLLGTDSPGLKLIQFFRQLKANDPTISLQGPIEIIHSLSKFAGIKNTSDVLSYLLRSINGQKDFRLTTYDLEKIEGISKAAGEVYTPPNKIPGMLKQLQTALNDMKNNKELSSTLCQIDEQRTEKPSLSGSASKSFHQGILLNTEAMQYANKIEKARSIINSDKPGIVREKERDALNSLDSKLGKIQKDLKGALGAITPTWLHSQISNIKHEISQASYSEKKPSNVFERIYFAIKSLFVRSKPTISETLQKVDTQLPSELDIQPPSSKP